MSNDYAEWLKKLGVDVNEYSWDPEDALTGGLETSPKLENKKKKKGGGKQPKTGKASGKEPLWMEEPTMGGRGAGLASEQARGGGNVSTSFMSAQGSAEAGYRRDSATGAEFAGAKASGKAAVAEVSADTPLGNVSASFLKAEGSAMAGYEDDPESKVTFAGVKASGSASVLDEKIEGKYGNVQGQLLSVSASSKTGVEVDDKTGKIFIGTSNSAEAKVAEVQGKLQTPDGSAQITGDVQVLKAEASADANVVVDKYGMDANFKLGAEANLVKAEVGTEYRLTPKALFDNTLGWMTNTTAPDVLDFGPVIGGKVSAAEGVGGTVEEGARLGVDECNIRGGLDLGLGPEFGASGKIGMRLGPLKVAYDNKDAILKAAGDLADDAEDVVSKGLQYGREVGIGLDPTTLGTAGKAVGEAASAAAAAASNAASAVGQGVGQAASAAAGAVSEAGSAVAGGVGEVASATAGAVSEVGSAVAGGVGQVASATAGAVSEVGSAVAGGVGEVASATAGAVSEVGSAVAGGVSGAAEGLANAASNTWDNLWN